MFQLSLTLFNTSPPPTHISLVLCPYYEFTLPTPDYDWIRIFQRTTTLTRACDAWPTKIRSATVEEQQKWEMAETPKRRVVLAMDGSEYADYAFNCKFLIHNKATCTLHVYVYSL